MKVAELLLFTAPEPRPVKVEALQVLIVAVVCFVPFVIFGGGHLMIPIWMTLGYAIGRSLQLLWNRYRS
jgi:hypothetical protein